MHAGGWLWLCWTSATFDTVPHFLLASEICISGSALGWLTSFQAEGLQQVWLPPWYPSQWPRVSRRARLLAPFSLTSRLPR